MKYRYIIAALVIVVAAGCASMGFAPEPAVQEKAVNSRYEEGRFQNLHIQYKTGLGKTLQIVWSFLTGKQKEKVPNKPIPVLPLGVEQLAASTDDSLYRLGHSTVLMRLSGQYLLTDPIFSERASPVTWAGPKRFHQSPIAIDDLPALSAVIISHDHYDHLDKTTILALVDKTEHFVTPLAVGQRLRNWGVPADKVVELDWWQSYRVADIELVATPTQHFSGRGLLDRDKTLWASWVIKSAQQSLFFSGDTGYFSGFAEIGRRYGPFDLTMIETGAYNQLWSEIHMHPSESVQAHIDLKGRVMLPIHNGTFSLAFHDWNEPMQLVSEIAERAGVHAVLPKFGEKISLEQPATRTERWW